MALPVSSWSLTIADNTRKPNGEPETTTLSVPIITLTPANVAATITLAGNLSAAIAGVTLGNILKNETKYAANQLAVGPAASNLAQRENKWLVRYHDETTFQKFQASIGTADLSLLPANSEFLDITAGAGLALKDAFEAVVVSPADASHTVAVDSVQFVGRNT